MPRPISPILPETRKVIRDLFAITRGKGMRDKTVAFDAGTLPNEASRMKRTGGTHLNTIVRLGKAAGLELVWREKDE